MKNILKYIKKNMLSSVIILTALASLIVSVKPAQATPLTSFAAACSPGRGGLSKTIFPPWYAYLPGEDSAGKCRINTEGKEVREIVVLIILAVIDLLIRVSGMIALGFMIYGSFQYIWSQGEPNGISAAKSTITNALIGLMIVILSTVIVQFLGRAMT